MVVLQTERRTRPYRKLVHEDAKSDDLIHAIRNGLALRHDRHYRWMWTRPKHLVALAQDDPQPYLVYRVVAVIDGRLEIEPQQVKGGVGLVALSFQLVGATIASAMLGVSQFAHDATHPLE